MKRIASWIGLFAASSLFLPACSGTRAAGLDTSTMPPDVRDDYAVFAQRCSKCHSLDRPLQAGVDSDEEWADYVERMRRQPSSGISRADVTVVQRFLHYYLQEQKRAKAAHDAEPPPAAPSAPVTAPPPTPDPTPSAVPTVTDPLQPRSSLRPNFGFAHRQDGQGGVR